MKTRAPTLLLAEVLESFRMAMGAIVSLIYREYCRARLAEMRKYHLTS